MKIAVASGKGGTGKTTLSIALALAAEELVQLLDCDVEEPNGHIFLELDEKGFSEVTVLVPDVDEEKCNACGKCAGVCEFNAIAVTAAKAMVFPELCHSCGGCVAVCPTGAIHERNNKIGSIMQGVMEHIHFTQGRLEVGHVLSPPLIRAVKQNIKPGQLNIIDCPPGNACPAVTALQGADYAVLVTEATHFGLHDLMISVETLRKMDLPFGVIINRADTGDGGVKRYCADEQIEVLLEIPESIEVAKAYSQGLSLLSVLPEIRADLRDIISHTRNREKES